MHILKLLHLQNSEIGRIILMILILLAAVMLGWLAKKLIYLVFKKSSVKRKTDPGNYVLLIFLVRLVILIVGVSYAISIEPNIRSATTSLLASAGIATAIIGFASKDVLSNLVSGAMIVLFKPFTLSHWIKVGNITQGSVEEIKMLYTVIKDISNRRLIIPNSKILSSDIINSSYKDQAVVQIVEFEIGYESDVDTAKKIIEEVAGACPLSMDKRTEAQKEKNEPSVEVRLFKMENHSIILGALIWVESPMDAITVSWCLNEDIKKRFKAEGIQIPYTNLIVRENKDAK